MPELAEVEYFRKQWDCGLGQSIVAVAVHGQTRPFRATRGRELQLNLPGSTLVRSQARGKQIAFCFSRGQWLGLHLGMTGKLKVAPPHRQPDKHDHLVLHQKEQSLVFTDPRQFGRVQFHPGPKPPSWWTMLSPDLGSSEFTQARMAAFLLRHGRLPLKAALLLQEGFPGVGNWMADEILWRTGLHPRRRSARLDAEAQANLWRVIRWVCRRALATIGRDYSDPPRGWLFHQRWEEGGLCPKHRSRLRRETVGGRTTAWCPRCQPAG